MSVADILRNTETLRKMLDERGVEHYDLFDVTEWVGSDGEICHTSVSHSNGVTVLVLRKCVTPAQAIAVTLGRGTCVPILNSERDRRPYLSLWFVCSECGCRLTENRLGKVWQKFCPQCGRRVKKVYEC